jgi:hypothetical protein
MLPDDIKELLDRKNLPRAMGMYAVISIIIGAAIYYFTDDWQWGVLVAALFFLIDYIGLVFLIEKYEKGELDEDLFK